MTLWRVIQYSTVCSEMLRAMVNLFKKQTVFPLLPRREKDIVPAVPLILPKTSIQVRNLRTAGLSCHIIGIMRPFLCYVLRACQNKQNPSCFSIVIRPWLWRWALRIWRANEWSNEQAWYTYKMVSNKLAESDCGGIHHVKRLWFDLHNI